VPKTYGVDLHLHTNVEGGEWELENLVECAAQKGIGVIGVTDHNTMENVEAVKAIAQPHGIRVSAPIWYTRRCSAGATASRPSRLSRPCVPPPT